MTVGTNPSRFPSGISTYTIKSTLNSFPSLPAPKQASYRSNFLPYVSGNWTITQTGSTLSQSAGNLGMVTVATGASSSDVLNAELLSEAAQFVPGNQLWFRAVMTPAGLTASDIYFGFADGTEFTSGTLQNGVYFQRPHGGTTLNFCIVKAGVITTFQNIADLQYPSAVYGNADGSTNGTLGFTLASGAYTAATVTTPGSGYVMAPLVQATGATGSGALLYCQLGSGGLYNPIIASGGSSYTTVTNSVYPWTILEMYYDGKGTLVVGVNGKNIITIGLDGAITGTSGGIVTTAGSTYNVATGNSTNYFVSGTTLTSGVMGVQPMVGDVANILPLVPLYPGFEVKNSSGTAQNVYIREFDFAGEYN